MLTTPLTIITSLAFGYCLGSIPFGLLLTRAAGTQDLRQIGSGNIGATNVLRTGRKDLTAATLLLDVGKGALAYIAPVLILHDERAGLVGIVGAIFGHLYPLWLRFRGGKGVATFLGGLVAANPLAALAFALVWLATARMTRYSSGGALAATLAAPLAAFWIGDTSSALVFFWLALLIWIKHTENIKRLLQGTEPRIGTR